MDPMGYLVAIVTIKLSGFYNRTIGTTEYGGLGKYIFWESNNINKNLLNLQ